MPFEWTPERLSARSSKELQQIAENANGKGRPDVADMCVAILEERLKAGKQHMSVAEFHFVCSADTGVQSRADGTFTTGVWVVSEVHRHQAIRDKAILALHQTKADPSYRQGTIVGWEDVPRDEFGEGTGVRFTVEPTATPVVWQGSGAGEKGYLWRERK